MKIMFKMIVSRGEGEEEGKCMGKTDEYS